MWVNDAGANRGNAQIRKRSERMSMRDTLESLARMPQPIRRRSGQLPQAGRPRAEMPPERLAPVRRRNSRDRCAPEPWTWRATSPGAQLGTGIEARATSKATAAPT
jgi:hypothetical protein